MAKPVDLYEEVDAREAFKGLVPLTNELRDSYNRHLAACPHRLQPGECEDPDCMTVWVMES